MAGLAIKSFVDSLRQAFVERIKFRNSCDVVQIRFQFSVQSFLHSRTSIQLCYEKVYGCRSIVP